jgi:Uma2 family endonuclease
MTLDDFDRAVAREGYRYELNKGVIEVSGIPLPAHAIQVQAVRNQLVVHQELNPQAIAFIGGGGEAKLLLGQDQSERHPDISVYLVPPPSSGDDVWSVWIPGIVVEVVSESSAKRDYQDKPPEYLRFGVREYWIIDPIQRQMTVLSRWRGEWKEKIVKPTQKYATPLLPGFSLDLKRVFALRK